MANTCFICKDNFNEIYKICQCEDSLICGDCLTISNAQHMNICPICRRPLNIKYIKQQETTPSLHSRTKRPHPRTARVQRSTL